MDANKVILLPIDHYQQVKAKLRQFSDEFLEGDSGVVELLERLFKEHPDKVNLAKNLDLLATSLLFLYLRQAGKTGRGGFTAKKLAAHFGVSAGGVSQKASDLDWTIFGFGALEEFIDKDRYEVNQLYWDFLDSPDAEDPKKSVTILKKIIQKDPDYFDPYLTLHDYYLDLKQGEKAFDVLYEGFNRASRLISKNRQFPKCMEWEFVENRHIIRIIYYYAIALWTVRDPDAALIYLKALVDMVPNDNIGARYAIAAILDGYSSLYEWESQFETEYGLDAAKVEQWFQQMLKKQPSLKEMVH